MIYTLNRYKGKLHAHQNDRIEKTDNTMFCIDVDNWKINVDEKRCIASGSVNWLQPLWRTVYYYLLKQYTYLPYEPKRHEHTCSPKNSYNSVIIIIIIIIICNSPKLQTTQLSINTRMDKPIVKTNYMPQYG